MTTVFFITPTCIPGSISKENYIGYCGCQGLFHSTLNYSVYRDTQKKISLENGFAIARKQMMRPLNVGSGTELSREASQFKNTDELKLALGNSLQGLNRGVFGVRTTKKAELEMLLKLLEGKNPLPNPTENLKMVDGQWRLLYSTISILGSKRTKLGLRDFITLGEFIQTVDVEKGTAENKIGFYVSGLGMLTGELTIEASFKIASPKRVNIQFKKSTIVPEKLLKLFRKNYDLLLSIFNPEGWLEITYIDDTTRIGRDDKGNIFLLERVAGGKFREKI